MRQVRAQFEKDRRNGTDQAGNLAHDPSVPRRLAPWRGLLSGNGPAQVGRAAGVRRYGLQRAGERFPSANLVRLQTVTVCAQSFLEPLQNFESSPTSGVRFSGPTAWTGPLDRAEWESLRPLIDSRKVEVQI
jgi:hypothetical protein